MFRFYSILIAALMVAGLAHAGFIATNLATAQGSISVTGSSTATITGTGTSTFVNTLFSSTITSPGILPTTEPTAQFFGNSSINNVPFVLDTNSAGDGEYVGSGATSTTTSLVIDMGGYTGANPTAGILDT